MMGEQEAKALLESLGYLVTKPGPDQVYLVMEPARRCSAARYHARMTPHALKSGSFYRAGSMVAKIPMESLTWEPFKSAGGTAF